MTHQEISEIFREVKSWNDATPKQRNAFAKEMEARQYGYSPLLSAWLWFLFGWNSYQE